jgi:small subunit ribosomal protein S1
MVIKRRYRTEPSEPPPPMNESWWEAILAEELAKNIQHSQENQRITRNIEDEEKSEIGKAVTELLDWQTAKNLFEQDQVIELYVTGFNRGGLLVQGEKIQGFVPISHLIETPGEEVDPEPWLETYVDRVLNLKIIECDQERGRVVFSERAAQAEPGKRRQLLNNLFPGTCVMGTVTNITDFGIFVDLGGIEGLVHVSEISWGRVHHPSDVASLGQKVQVYVIQVDPERARIALSFKRLHSNPWETAEERYYAGQVTEATITSIVPFGAFARLEDGLDGLIHISEFRPEENPNMNIENLNEGQRIQVRVLHVDATRQRLGLSLDLNGDFSQPME